MKFCKYRAKLLFQTYPNIKFKLLEDYSNEFENILESHKSRPVNLFISVFLFGIKFYLGSYEYEKEQVKVVWIGASVLVGLKIMFLLEK